MNRLKILIVKVLKINLALKQLDKKNLAADPKKAGKTPDPKAKAQPPKPDPKKKETSKPANGMID